uniref:Down syndrome cell adhesion molecule-like protein Dscam2 n=1 Tax=Strigamia maritima TaxID=126957 RepID=T1IT85_STRMM
MRQIQRLNDSLTISDVHRTEDSGIYICSVQSNKETKIRGKIQLNVLVAPKLAPFSFQDELVQEGSRGRLQCVVVEGDTPLSIHWDKDGKPIPSDFGVTVRDIDEFSSILTIVAITPRHNGKYTCRATNAAGTVSFSTHLAVNVSQGDLPISFKWLKDGQDISSSGMGIIMRDYDGHAKSLSIESVLSIHTGNYTCVASNKAASVTYTAQLLVYVPPKIVPFDFRDEHLIEGSLLRVSCVVSRGDLPLVMTWLKDGKLLPESVLVREFDSYSTVLSIDPVKKEHTGNYTCKAENQAGIATYNAELIVQVPPKWIVEPISQTVSNGEDAYFHCKADGYPVPKVSWMFAKESKGSESYPIYSNTETKILPNGTLILKSVSKVKEGRYVCLASNGVGRNLNMIVLLSVLAPPYFTKKSQQFNENIDADAQLVCAANGDPPMKFSWQLHNKFIKETAGSRFKISQDGINSTSSTLLIKKLTREDSTKYICEAKNSFGNDTIELELNVQEPPEVPVLESQLSGDNWQLKKFNETVDGSKTATNIINLQPATSYSFRVAAVNAIGISKFSNEIIQTTDMDVPTGTVQNVEVEAIDGNTFRITWKPPRKDTWNGIIRGYNIGYRINGSYGPYEFSALEVPEDYMEDLIYQITNLHKYTMYNVVIQVYNDKGVGPLTEPILVMTSEDVPSQAPGELRCSALSSKSIYVLWEPVPSETINGILRGYKVIYKPMTEWYDLDVQYKTSEKERLTLSQLSVNTNYSIVVLAFTKVGDGIGTEPVYCKTHEDVPDRPNKIKVLPASSDSVVVAWKPPNRINGDVIKYNIYYRPLSESEEIGPDALLRTEQSKTNNVHTFQSDMEYFEVKGLRKNQKYAFWVTATSAIGEGQHSDVIAQSAAASTVAATAASFDDVIHTPWKRDVTLPCRAVGIPTPQHKWAIGHESVSIGGRKVLLSDGTLLINKVDSKDSGNYTCTIYNIHGKDEVHYNLNVQVPPSAPILDIISKTRSSIQFQWKPSENGGDSIKGYILHYKRDNSDWETIELSPDKEVFTLNNLACGVNYHIYMEAFNKVGKGVPCDILKTSTEGSGMQVRLSFQPFCSFKFVCSSEVTIPTREQLLHEGSTFVSVHLESWPITACTVQTFQVEYKTLNSDSEWTTVSSSIRPTQRKLVIPGLIPATWYDLRVTAITNGDAIPAEYKFATLTATGGKIPLPEIRMEKPQSPVYIFYLDPYIFIPAVALLIVVIITSAIICIWIKERVEVLGHHQITHLIRGEVVIGRHHPTLVLPCMQPFLITSIKEMIPIRMQLAESITFQILMHGSGFQETVFGFGHADGMQPNDGYDKPPKGIGQDNVALYVNDTIPTFINVPPPIVDFSNSTGVSLQCKSSQPEDKIQWYLKDGTLVTNVNGLRAVDKGKITFSPFSAEAFRQDVHATVYKCTATNTLGTVVSHDIQVKAVVLQPYDVYVYDVYAIQENTAVMRCHVPTFLMSYVNVTAWIRDSVVIIKSAQMDENSKYSLMPSGDLFIKDVDMNDGMTSFHCQTYNRLTGETVRSAMSGKLFVTESRGNVPPKIIRSEKKVHVKQGKTAFLPCEVQANPTANTSWQKIGTQEFAKILLNRRHIQVSGSLIIGNVKSSDNGIYRCTSYNSVGQEYSDTELVVTESLAVATEPKSATVDAGKQTSIVCKPNGIPIQSLKWLKNGKPISLNKHVYLSNENDTLHIMAASADVRGVYQCCVANEYETACGSSAIFLGDMPPLITEWFSTVVKNPGDRIKLKCAAKGNPLPSFSWFLDDNVLQSNGQLTIKESTSGDVIITELTIKKSKTEDGGLYKCVAENRAGSSFYWSRINIYGDIGMRHAPPLNVVNGANAILNCPVYGYPITDVQWEKVAPKLSPFSFQDELVQEGSRGRLQCVVVEGDTPLSIHWEKDGKPIPSDFGVTVRDIDEFSSILTIVAITPRHNGKYTCRATNAAGTVIPPKILPFAFQDDQFFKGMRAHIVCAVSQGDLPISFKWLKDGQDISSSGMGIIMRDYDGHAKSLSIESVLSIHTGNYTCVAIPPKIVPFAFQDEHLIEGSLLRVSCVVSRGDLPLAMTWLKDGKLLPESVLVREFDSYSTVLSIDPVKREHTGNYTCKAENQAGIASYNAELIVQVPPKWIVEPTSQTLTNGADAYFHCKAEGYPVPKITWMFAKESKGSESYPIYSNAETEIFPNGTLILKSVSKVKEGRYACLASNGVGHNLNMMVLLTVLAPPYFTQKIQRLNNNIDTDAQLVCSANGDPPMNFSWQLHNEPIREAAESKFKISQDGINSTSSTLIIRKTSREDSTVYICEAKNSYGKATIEMHLNIQEPPEVPVLESQLSGGNRSAFLTWEKPFDGHSQILHYLVQYKRQIDNWQLKKFNETVDGSKTATNIINLQPATSYSFRVAAVNAIGISKFSNEIIQITDMDVPTGTVQNVEVEAIDGNTFRITWKPPRKDTWNGIIRGYNIGYQINGSYGPYEFSALEVPEDYTEDLIYQITNLHKYTMYNVVIQVYNDKGVGPLTEPILVMTSEDVPSQAPGELRCSALSSKSIYVLWEPVPPETVNGILRGYKVIYKPMTEWYDLEVQHKTSEKERLTLSQLSVNTNYSIVVLAFTKVGDGVGTEPVYCKTHEDVPDRPNKIKVLPASSDSVVVAWKPPNRINGDVIKYNIYYRPLSESEEIGSDALLKTEQSKTNNVHTFQSDMEYFEVKGLRKNQKYAFWVTATSAIGEGQHSDVIAQTVADSAVAATAASFDDVIHTPWKRDVTLPCRAVGIPTPQHKWAIGHESVSIGGRKVLLSDGTLLINKVDSKDSGNYTCTIYNIHGKDEVHYNLNVQVPPSAPILDIISKTRSSLQFQWKPSENGGDSIKGYILHYKRDNSDWETIELSPDKEVFTLNNLACGVNYHIYMEAFIKLVKEFLATFSKHQQKDQACRKIPLPEIRMEKPQSPVYIFYLDPYIFIPAVALLIVAIITSAIICIWIKRKSGSVGTPSDYTLDTWRSGDRASSSYTDPNPYATGRVDYFPDSDAWVETRTLTRMPHHSGVQGIRVLPQRCGDSMQQAARSGFQETVFGFGHADGMQPNDGYDKPPKGITMGVARNFRAACLWISLLLLSPSVLQDVNDTIPTFVDVPSPIIDFSNSTGGSLQCKSSQPEDKIQWYLKDGTLVTNVNGLRAVDKGKITFPPFSAEAFRQDVHATVYKCTATNTLGTVVSHDIQVKAVVLQPYDVYVYDVYAIQENTAVMRCHVPTFLMSYVNVTAWIRDSVVIIKSAQMDENSKYSLMPSGDLFIKDVDMNDGMTSFHCQTYNRLTGETVRSAMSGKLFVTESQGNVPPKIILSEKKVSVRQGQTAFLPCEVQANPTANTSWQKIGMQDLAKVSINHRHIQVSGSLIIGNVKSSDSGIYRCISFNSVGHESFDTELVVTESLSVVTEPKSVTVDAGKQTSIVCKQNGISIQSLKWLKNGKPISLSKRVSLSNENDTVHITAASADDKGVYQCCAANEYETACGSTAILLGDMPPLVTEWFSTIVKTPGDRIKLKCAAKGNPLPEFLWFLDDNELQSNGQLAIKESTNSGEIISELTIKRIKTEDGGLYKCRAENRAGSAFYWSRINIYGDIGMRQTPALNVVNGAIAVLNCPVYGYPLKDVQWEKDDLILPQDMRQIQQLNDSLTIYDVHRTKDSGIYICSVSSNKQTTIQGKVRLNVLVAPKLSPFSFQDELVQEGSRGRLQCVVVEGDTPLTIHWEKDDKPISSDFGVTVRDIDEFSSILTIVAITPRHNGKYTCRATNAAGTVSFSTHLAVNVPPKIVPFTFQDEHLIEGSLLRVSCVVSRGDLPLAMTWLKDGKLVPDSVLVREFDSYSTVLSIDPVKREHTGNYTCKAENQAGVAAYNAELIVQAIVLFYILVPPKWIVEPTSQTVTNGADAYFHCRADGYPMPEITWMFAKESKGSKSYPIYSNMETNILSNGTLILKNVSKAKEGRYVCLASNGVGHNLNMMVLLTVLAPPFFIQKRQRLNENIDTDAQLVCAAKGDLPMSFSWQLNNEHIKETAETRFKIIPNGTNSTSSTLLIQKITREDSTVFICEAKNSFGKDTMELVLNVQEPPEAPVLESQHSSGNRLVLLTWKKPFDGNSQILHYLVQYKRQVDNWQLKKFNETVDGSKTATNIINLQPATSYSFRIAAVNAIGVSKFSNEITQTTDMDVPTGTVQNVEVEAIDGNTFRITWKPPRKDTWNGIIRGYNIGYRVNGSYAPYEFSALEVPEDYTEDLIYQITNLHKYTMYTVVIQVYNDKGVGPLTEPILVMTSEDIPSQAPDELRCSALSSKSIYVLWEPVPPETVNGILRGYKVIYKPMTEWYDLEVQYKTSEKERLTLPQLSVNTNYSIVVLAFTKVGDGVRTSPVYCKTHEDVPDRPNKIKVLPASSDSVVVAWKPPKRINGDVIKYNIYYRPLSESEEAGPDALLKTEQSKTNNVHTFQSDMEYFEVKGLRKNQKYAFWVSATSAIGEGQHSDVIAQTVADSAVAATAASFDDIIYTPWKRDVTLPCRAVGIPTPQHKWVIGHESVPIGGRKVLLSDGTLLINKVESKDSGNYTCTIYNVYGKDEVHYNLNIQVPPAAPILDIISKTRSSIQFQWKPGQNGGDSIKGYILHYKRDNSDWETVELSSDKELARESPATPSKRQQKDQA